MTIATGTGANPVLFNARRFAGNATARSITGYGFTPDLVWIKPRDTAEAPVLYDSVRGITKKLASSAASAETTQAQGITAFISDGVSMGTTAENNGATGEIVMWGWKAGGAPSGVLAASGETAFGANSDYTGLTTGAGTIHNSATGVSNLTSLTQSVNQTSGFSITKFAGHTSGGTFPHNLGGTPDFIIIKKTTGTGNWHTWHQNLHSPAQYYLKMNTDVAQSNDTSGYSTAPSPTIITTGNNADMGGSTATFICYAWKAVSGVSAFGTYEGDGGSNRTITTGFQPKFVMVKCIDVASRNWIMQDSLRDSGSSSGNNLYANLDYVEDDDATHTINFDATGFSFTTGSTYDHINDNGETFVYCAFA